MAISLAVNLSTQGRDRNGITKSGAVRLAVASATYRGRNSVSRLGDLDETRSNPPVPFPLFGGRPGLPSQ